MGCANDSNSVMLQNSQYSVLTSELVPNNSKKFIISQINSQVFEKIQEETLFSQCGKCSNIQIANFFKDISSKSESFIFFIFSSRGTYIRFFEQMKDYSPTSNKSLNKIIAINISQAVKKGISKEGIAKAILDFGEEEIIGSELDLDKVKEAWDLCQDPNITINNEKDEEKEEGENEEDPFQEKEGEILIMDEVNKNTIDRVVTILFDGESPLKKKSSSKNKTKTEKLKKSNCSIHTIKILSAKFPKIEHFKQLMDIINQYPNLKKFYFYDNIIQNNFQGFSNVYECLNCHSSLRTVDIHSTNLYDNNLEPVGIALLDKRINTLDLSENFLTSSGIKTLVPFLKSNKTLKKLLLQRNAVSQFGMDGVRIVTEALWEHPNITYINFSFMDLTGCGQYIAELMKKNKNFSKVNLKDTKLNFKDFKSIFEALAKSNTFKDIDVSLNNMGGDKSLEQIAQGIKDNKSLEKIKLENLNINMDNYILLFDAFASNKTITHYNLSYNSELKPKVLLTFFFGLKNVKYLEYIPYDKDNDKDRGKDFTLEEKKLIEQIKNERKDMNLIIK